MAIKEGFYDQLRRNARKNNNLFLWWVEWLRIESNPIINILIISLKKHFSS